MNVRFVAGFGAIVADVQAGHRFYGEQLSLPLHYEPGSDYTAVALPGIKHFGLWGRKDAARSAFAREEWPETVPPAQANIELEVDDVHDAVRELRTGGVHVLREAAVEPWGQTTARLLSPEGLLISVVYTPDLRDGTP